MFFKVIVLLVAGYCFGRAVGEEESNGGDGGELDKSLVLTSISNSDKVIPLPIK